MSSWGRLDQADNAPLWAGNQLGLAPSDANRTDLFEDATADNFITGMTIGYTIIMLLIYLVTQLHTKVGT